MLTQVVDIAKGMEAATRHSHELRVSLNRGMGNTEIGNKKLETSCFLASSMHFALLRN